MADGKSKQEWADQFRIEILKASDKNKKIKEIFDKIDGFVYPDTKKPLNLEDKLEIIYLIKKGFPTHRVFHRDSGDSILEKSYESWKYNQRIVSATDNTEIIKMLSTIEIKMKEREGKNG